MGHFVRPEVAILNGVHCTYRMYCTCVCGNLWQNISVPYINVMDCSYEMTFPGLAQYGNHGSEMVTPAAGVGACPHLGLHSISQKLF